MRDNPNRIDRLNDVASFCPGQTLRQTGGEKDKFAGRFLASEGAQDY
jgi:hypothetical protein